MRSSWSKWSSPRPADKINHFPPDIVDFGVNFRSLKSQRHSADDDLACRLTLSQVERQIDIAEAASRKLSAAHPKDRCAFATLVLFPPTRP